MTSRRELLEPITVPFWSIRHIPVTVTLWISSTLWHRQLVTVTGSKNLTLGKAQTVSKWQFWMHFVVNWDGQKLREAGCAKTYRNSRFLSWVSEFRHCNIGLGDVWQGPIFDRTLEPVMRDCRIDRNGTVCEYAVVIVLQPYLLSSLDELCHRK